MRITSRTVLLALTVLLPPLTTVASSGDIKKEFIQSQGKKRSYYLVVPGSVSASPSAPLLVTLHGSGRNGLSLVEKWKGLAEKQGIVVVGPDSLNSAGWFTPADGPEFLHDLIESLISKQPIDPRRIYLFGHSAGASFALHMSLLESRYFAAASVHAGSLKGEAYVLIDHAKRKTPIFIQVGTADEYFPLKEVRATRDELNRRGFSVQLSEITNHGHDYYSNAEKINRAAWQFLSKHELAEDPQYERYRFRE